jgi:hypothetical protein
MTIEDEQLNYLFKKYSRVPSTNTSITSMSGESLSTSGAKAVIQQEDIYASSIPAYTSQANLETNFQYRYTQSVNGLAVDVLKCLYSGGTWGATIDTISVVSAGGVSVSTATLVQNYSLTVDIWEGFQQSKLYRAYTISSTPVIVKLEGVVLSYMDGTRDSSPSYYHKLLVGAIPFTTSTAAYSGSLATSDGTGIIYSDADGSWIIQSDCGVLQFFNQAATKTLNGSACNLFPITGATGTTWFPTSVDITFWKYIGRTGTSTLGYKDDYNFIDVSYDSTSTTFNGAAIAAPTKTSIKFHEYGSLGAVKNTYDARIYATDGTSSLFSKLVYESTSVVLPLLPNRNTRSPYLNFGTYAGIYLADTTTNSNPSFNATPCSSGTITSALRMRCLASDTSGFIFENDSEQALASLSGSSGGFTTKGTIVVGGSLTVNGTISYGGTQTYTNLNSTGAITLGSDQTFTYASGVSNTGTTDTLANASVFGNSYGLNVASTGAAVTIKGRPLQITGGYLNATVYNSNSGTTYRPSAYGGDLLLKGGDYYNAANNGSGYVNMAGGNVYIQSGNSLCGSSAGGTAPTLVSPFIQMDVQSTTGYGAEGTRKTMMKIDNTSVLLGGKLQIAGLSSSMPSGSLNSSIYMGSYNDTTWGIYMSDTKSLSGGTATSGSSFITSWALRFRCHSSSAGGFMFENNSEGPLLAIRGDGPAKFYSQLEVAGGLYCYGSILVNPSSVTSTPPAIRFWGTSDTNWAIYMALDNNLDGTTACDGFNGLNSYAVRFRVANGSTSGFIWENSDNTCLMSLDGANGSLATKGNLTVTGQISVNQTITASSGYLRVEKYYSATNRYGMQYCADGWTRLVMSNEYTAGGFKFSRASGDNSFAADLMTCDYYGNMVVSGQLTSLGAKVGRLYYSASFAQIYFTGTLATNVGFQVTANATVAVISGYIDYYVAGGSGADNFDIRYRIGSDVTTMHSGGPSGRNVWYSGNKGVVTGPITVTAGSTYDLAIVVYFTSLDDSIYVRGGQYWILC